VTTLPFSWNHGGKPFEVDGIPRMQTESLPPEAGLDLLLPSWKFVGPILFFIFGAKEHSVNCVGPFFVDFVVLAVCESASELCSGFSICM
jgi:hypothetical protein